jgi:hypothetical protein
MCGFEGVVWPVLTHVPSAYTHPLLACILYTIILVQEAVLGLIVSLKIVSNSIFS